MKINKLFILILSGLAFCLSIAQAEAQNKVRIFEHKVAPKETLYSLAKKYYTDIESIYKLNPWLRQEGLKAGDKIMIRFNPPTQAKGTKKTNSEEWHTIAYGETLYSISKRYGLTVKKLMDLNPDLFGSDIKSGSKIRIADKRQKAKAKAQEEQALEARRNAIATQGEGLLRQTAVKALLLLPFEKSSYYVEFYEGFLMALNDLKQKNISVQLRAEIVNDSKDLQKLIKQGVLKGQDLVFGGTNAEEVQLIHQAITREETFFVSPFVTMPAEAKPLKNFVQLRESRANLEAAVVKAFVEKFEENPIYLITAGEETQYSSLAKLLEKTLQEKGIEYQTLIASSDELSLMKSAVVVPVNDEQALAERLFASLDRQSLNYTVFGYPRWQSYDDGRTDIDSFNAKMHLNNTIIYSQFFIDFSEASIDLPSIETKDFLIKYRAWFDKKVGASYPKYSLLGYDVARYFIRAYAMYQSEFVNYGYSLPFDGLQMDIELNKFGDAYLNQRYYWISFEADGFVKRQSYQIK